MKKIIAMLLAAALIAALAVAGFATEEITLSEPAADPSPALYVSQKNRNSVVGVITGTLMYDRYTGEPDMNAEGQGSGVVIADGGYILTNYHVVESGSDYQVLLYDGTKVKAEIQGSDPDMDLAVLKVTEGLDQLTTVEIGSSSELPVGSTVVAIGNPGGEILAHSVTQGIVSALERSAVSSDNTTRNVDYIQHDAPISSGNSGGGLFDYKGRLVGINTLKYGNNAMMSNSSYEGLGFAIPIDAAWPIAQQLIENGKVVRPQLGVTVKAYDGGEEPEANKPPKSVCVYKVNEDGAADKAGMKQYDFIYAVEGERVTTTRELVSKLDDYKEGDTITVTVVRYDDIQEYDPNSYDNYYDNYGNYGNNRGNYGYGMSPFDFFFGNGGYGYNYGGNYNQQPRQQESVQIRGNFEKIDLKITLELPQEKNEKD